MRKKSYPSNLAIIPARGGSKRLKNKNKLLLFGKPLVRHTVQAALMSNKITDVLVSSDSDDILDIACLEKNIIRHKRDDSLATDTSTALELVNNIVENSSKEYDFITLMLPTCPLRTHQHIDTAFDLISGEDDGVISVTTYNFPIELKVTTDGEYIKLSDDSPLITGNTRSQNYQPALRPNGGFYIARWNSFVKNKNFWKGRVKYFIMNNADSVDIDTETDLQHAEILLRNRNK